MSYPIRRHETKILPSSMIDSGLSYHGKPVLQRETVPEDENVNPVADISDLMLPEELTTRMFSHQVEGLQWLYGLHLNHPGGILGDDMGLGKTFQVNCLLTGLMRSNKIQRALIIAPVSVLPSWNRELLQHLAPYVKRVGIEMCSSEMTKKKRQKILSDVFASRNSKIVISSYNLVANMTDEFAGGGSWDYVILDEGHIIKNPTTKLSKAMHMLKSNHRLILTGTPIQNNLVEFWALVNWATSGNLLGTKAHFKARYVDPILAGQEPKASMSKIEESRTAAAHLMRTIEPILLQRKKCEHTATLKLKKKVEMVVWIPLSTTQRKVYEMYLRNRTVQDALERKNFAVDVINDLKTISRHPFLKEASESLKKISGKETGESRTKSDTDYGSLEAAFTSMTLDRNGRGGRGAADDEEDEDEDDNYNIGRAKDSRFNTSTCKQRGLHALPARTTRPVKSSTPRSCQRNRLDGVDCQSEDDEADRSRADRKVGANASVFEIAGREPDVEELFQDSIKLRVLVKLTQRLKRAGHRLLVFSQSKKMLDIIQKVLSSYGMSSCRIDGSVTGRDRQRIIDDFNSGGECEEEGEPGMWDSVPKGGRDRVRAGVMGPSICLLTTKACGQGITLTGADRVVIFDPSWNPAEDRQAVDRAFRIGQKKDVVVYRLIMASSVEEKMYEKQVFKDGVRIVTESGSSSRYFSSAETKDLFTLGPPDKSEVMERLWAMTGTQLRSFEDTGGDLPKVCGYTRHDTLYAEARPASVQNRTGQKGGGAGAGAALLPSKPNPSLPARPTFSQESKLRDLDPRSGEERHANPMDKWVTRPVTAPHPRACAKTSVSSTIDLSQDSPPPTDRAQRPVGGEPMTSQRTPVLLDVVGNEESEEDNGREDLRTAPAPAAVEAAQVTDQSERAQFWASIRTDDSDAEGEEEEEEGEEEEELNEGWDSQLNLDLDQNGENGGCFKSSGFSDGEGEVTARPKSSIRVVRTSILMGRDYYSRPGVGRDSTFQPKRPADEDHAEQLCRERDSGAGLGSCEESAGVTEHHCDDDSDGEGGFEDIEYLDAEGDAAAALDAEDLPSGCDTVPSTLLSPVLAEAGNTRSVAHAQGRLSTSRSSMGLTSASHEHLEEESNTESGDDRGCESESEGESCSDSVTIKATRTPHRDPGPRPIEESAIPVDSRGSVHSSAAPGGAQEDRRASGQSMSGGLRGGGRDGVRDGDGGRDGGRDGDGGHDAEWGSVSETDTRVCGIRQRTQVVDDDDVAELLAGDLELEENIDWEEEREGEAAAAMWSKEVNTDSEQVEDAPGVEAGARVEGVGEGEGPDSAGLSAHVSADISGEWKPQDFRYEPFCVGALCEREALDVEMDQETLSESCQESQEETSHPQPSGVRDSESQDKSEEDEPDQSRNLKVMRNTETSVAELRRSSCWTALSPGTAGGALGLDSNLEVYDGSGGNRTPSPSSCAELEPEQGPCPAAGDAPSLSWAVPDSSSVHDTPRKILGGLGAAYHTPGRVVLHVETPHSLRGFCVALDSESDSDGDGDGDNDGGEGGRTSSGPQCSSPLSGDEDRGEERDTVSPLGRSPLPAPRNSAEYELSPPFSLPMSPMSASTTNSAVTSFSLSPHAIRSLALARLNLATESNIKVCPSTMAPETGKNFRGSRACDLVRIRLAGTAFESSPPRSSLPHSTQEPCTGSKNTRSCVGAETGFKGRSDDFIEEEESAREGDEVSETDTVFLEYEREIVSPAPAQRTAPKMRPSKAGENEDEDEDEWVPRSAYRQRTVKLSCESDPSSEDENESAVSVVRSPAATAAPPLALSMAQNSQRDRSRVFVLDDSDDDDDVAAMPKPQSEGGRGRSAAVRSIVIDSDEESYADSGSVVISVARPGARDYGRLSGRRSGGREGVLNSSDDDDEAEEGEEEDSGDEELVDEDEPVEGDVDDEASDEEHELDFCSLPSSKCKERAFLEFSAIDIVPLMGAGIGRERGGGGGGGGGGADSDSSADKENRRAPANLPFRGPVDRPAHSISGKQMRMYNQKVLEAQSSEGRQELEPALEAYLAALEICDADPALHGKMAYLSRELDYF